MKEERACIVCGSFAVMPFLRIDAAPAYCSQLCSSRTEALSVPAAPISLGFCSSCGHIFNVDYGSVDLTYKLAYENALGGSDSFRVYDNALADSLLSRYRLSGRLIVEIGCGRGQFLRTMCARGGNSGVGFDPSYDGVKNEQTSAERVVIHPEAYSSRHLDLRPDFICSRHTLEHIGEPRHFLASVRQAARRAGVPVFFEVPNGLYTLRDGGIWDIIYEHCSYFTPSSLARAFQNTGYSVIEVEEAFAGQFLTIHAATADFAPAVGPSAGDEIERMISTFAVSFERKLITWRGKLKELEDNNRKIVIWGAGAKATMFLNLLKPPAVNYIIDVNPRKHGKYMIGTGQRIVPPEILRDYPADEIICMNPNYAGEIIARARALGSDASVISA